MKKIILTLLIFFPSYSFSQLTLDKKLWTEVKGGKYSFQFNSDMTFKKYIDSDLYHGGLIEEKGTYKVVSDSLFVYYDYSYPNYQQDLEKQHFEVLKNSGTESKFITIDLTVIDTEDGYPIPDAEIIIKEEKYWTDYDGKAKIRIVKSDSYEIIANYEDSPPINLIVDGNKNYEILCRINPDMHDLSKDYRFGFKIKNQKKYDLVLIFKPKNGKRVKRKFKAEK